MFWRRRRTAEQESRPLDPIVFPVTRALTREVAEELAVQAQRLSGRRRIVIDLTGIPAFDTDGAFTMARLQERLGTATRDEDGWVIRRMRNTTVVQAGGHASADDLEAALSTALDQEVAIVVADLRGVPLTALGVDAVAFASSAAAVRGQELLVVNVDHDAAERLRLAGLSATTFVAPEE